MPAPGTPYFIIGPLNARLTRGDSYAVVNVSAQYHQNPIGGPDVGVTCGVDIYYGAIMGTTPGTVSWDPVAKQGNIGIAWGDGQSRQLYLHIEPNWTGVLTLITLGVVPGGTLDQSISGAVGAGALTITELPNPVPPSGTTQRLSACGFELQPPVSFGSGPEATQQNIGLTPGRIIGHAYTLAGYQDGVTPTGTQWIIPPADASKRIHYERFYIRVRAYPTGQGLRIHAVHSDQEATDAFLTVLESDGTLHWYNQGQGARTAACAVTTPLTLNVWYRVSLFYSFCSDSSGLAVNDNAVFIVIVTQATVPHRLILVGTPSANLFDFWYSTIDSDVLDVNNGAYMAHIDLTTSGGAAPYPGFSPGVVWRGTHNDATWAIYCGAKVSQYGLSLSNVPATLWQSTRFGSPASAQVDTDGGVVDLDDYVADGVICPGPGWIAPWRVVGAGTYAQWDGTQDYRAVLQNPTAGDSASPRAVRNSTGLNPGAAISFLCGPPEGVTGVIRSAQIGLYGAVVRNNWKFLLRINGVDHTISSVANSSAWITPSTSKTGRGWLVDAAAIGGISPSDTIEIGFIDGSSAGAGTTWLSQAVLLIEHESPDPAVVDLTQLTNLRVEIGSFTGNDTYQDYGLVDQPSFLMLRPDGVGGGGMVWSEGHGPNGQYGIRMNASDYTHGGLTQVFVNNFGAIQDPNSNTNKAATVIRYLAIHDPSRRMIQVGNYMVNSALSPTVADPTIALADGGFVPEGLFVFAGYTSGTGKHSYRGTSHQVDVSALSSHLDTTAADQANAIISMAAGQFKVGSVLDSTNFDEGFYLALRTNGVFNAVTLLQIGEYQGTGAASQNVVFNTPLGAAGVVFVIPTTARERVYRFAPDTTGRNWNTGAAVADSITAFTATGFTVGNSAGHNTNNEKFNYVAFAVGEDLPPPLPPIVAEIPPGALGVIVDMPNLLGGFQREVEIPPGAMSVGVGFPFDQTAIGIRIETEIPPGALQVTADVGGPFSPSVSPPPPPPPGPPPPKPPPPVPCADPPPPPPKPPPPAPCGAPPLPTGPAPAPKTCP